MPLQPGRKRRWRAEGGDGDDDASDGEDMGKERGIGGKDGAGSLVAVKGVGRLKKVRELLGGRELLGASNGTRARRDHAMGR